MDRARRSTAHVYSRAGAMNCAPAVGRRLLANVGVRTIQRGFTLIEMLVVIVIVGIIVTMATLSVGVLGRDNEVEDQAKRLYAVLTEVREEAELQGRDLGLLVERDGYLFMRYDYALKQWQTFQDDELLDYRKLPEGLQFRLWLDGREVILKTHSDNQELMGNADSSSSSSGIVNSPTSTTISGLRPQIAVLSSGDILPFELQLARDGNDFYWHVTGGADNTLKLESGGNAP
jgi:general secretion pathway protein H